uniref:Uncharacterized protein n=1 Tax=Glossina austeni TaxID=7395 RepID=A0A1A9VY83_GLOAU
MISLASYFHFIYLFIFCLFAQLLRHQDKTLAACGVYVTYFNLLICEYIELFVSLMTYSTTEMFELIKQIYPVANCTRDEKTHLKDHREDVNDDPECRAIDISDN